VCYSDLLGDGDNELYGGAGDDDIEAGWGENYVDAGTATTS
jgi:hypothetical protein